MDYLYFAAWATDARAGLREFYTFTRLDPGSAFVVLAVALLVGRKVARHFIKGNNYRLQDFWKYPGEWLELGAIGLLLLVGLAIKAVC